MENKTSEGACHCSHTLARTLGRYVTKSHSGTPGSGKQDKYRIGSFERCWTDRDD
jgi:hypothetical protein